MLLSKIDVLRAFRNLRVDPLDYDFYWDLNGRATRI